MPSDNLFGLMVTMRRWRFWTHRYAPVWFDPMPKQKVFLSTKVKERWLSGGIRSGKSECGAAELALLAWGVKGLLYPGFPKDGKKRDFWAVALSADKQRDTLRRKLNKMLGPKAKWREAEHTYVLPNGSTIELKTQESDADKFQSVDIDGAWVDEIGRDEERYNHILDRLIDRKGCVWTTFAPTRGMGWYYTIFEKWQEATNGQEVPANNILFLRLFTEDNAFLPKSEVAWRKSSMSSDTELRVKFYGEMVELRGLIYPTFDPPRHVIPCLRNGKCSIPPSPSWLIIRGHDYGSRSPSACAWVGIDPRDKTLTVFREAYQRGLSVPQVAFLVKSMSPPDERVLLDVGDPSLWNQEPLQSAVGRFIRLKDLYHEHGIPLVPANNRWEVGVEWVTQLLGPRDDKTPRLRIHQCCVNGIREFRRHHWPEGGSDTPGANAAMGDDHFLDACVTGDTMILTPQGEVPIRELADRGECEVTAFDESSGTFRCARAIAYKTKDSAPVHMVAGVRCTAEHPILTNHGWKKAGELLLPLNSGLRYATAHERPHRDLSDLSGVRGPPLLPERSVLRMLEQEEVRREGNTPSGAPRRVDGGSRSDTGRVACAPPRPRSDEQQALEPSVPVSRGPHEGTPRESGSHEGMAPLGARTGVASRTLQGDCGKDADPLLELRHLREPILSQERGPTLSLLWKQLQDEALPQDPSRLYLPEEEAVYNLTVEHYETFVANGTVVHNCRYASMAAKPYLDGSEPSGGFNSTPSSHESFSEKDSPEGPDAPCTPQVRMVKVLDPITGVELSHHYERVWLSEAPKDDDGFNA